MCCASSNEYFADPVGVPPFEEIQDMVEAEFDVKESFDLIIFSHSIMYLSDLRTCFGQIQRLLKDNGVLFIQVPNIAKNPFYMLMGDQHHIFTIDSLKNILEEQYLLSRKCSTSPIESNMMPDFEREIFVNMIIKEVEEEKKAMDNK